MIFELINPQKIWGNFQKIWYKVWYNGGELNVEKINSTEIIESVCSTCVSAETVAYRIYKTMTGEGFDHKTQMPSLESVYGNAK